MQVNNNFITNLIQTSQSGSLIKDDGTAFTKLDYIQNFFNSLIGKEVISPEEHFKNVCLKLINNEDFKNLNTSDQLVILGHINEIKNKRFSHTQNIGQIIRTFSSQIKLNDTKIYSVWDQVRLNLREADEQVNLQKFKYSMKVLDALVNVAANSDQKVINTTYHTWLDIYNKLKDTDKPHYAYDKHVLYSRKLNKDNDKIEEKSQYSINSGEIRKLANMPSRQPKKISEETPLLTNPHNIDGGWPTENQ